MLHLKPRAVDKELKGRAVDRTAVCNRHRQHETGTAHVQPNQELLLKFSHHRRRDVDSPKVKHPEGHSSKKNIKPSCSNYRDSSVQTLLADSLYYCICNRSGLLQHH